MIVYGDPSRRESLDSLITGVRNCLRDGLSASTLDGARCLLVQAGELEQAVHDGSVEEGVVRRCEVITDVAADLFLAQWAETQSASWTLRFDAGVARQNLQNHLKQLPRARTELHVKSPEGFAFYGVLPDSYATSALGWNRDYGTVSEGVVVVGLRTIGTALSAVVAGVLRRKGRRVHRLTVRPEGHPFRRSVEIEVEDIRGAQWGLIVDEGPGLSGSSLVAAAEALHRAGISRDHINFFPGHGGAPGNEATHDALRWWRETPRYVTTPGELRWHGRSRCDILAAETLAIVPMGAKVERIEDHSGGRWREAAFPLPSLWPEARIPFEREKYRVVLSNGQSILWKYEGLNVASPRRPETEWTIPIQGRALGFEATNWIEGRRLTAMDADLVPLGQYIEAIAGPPLTVAEFNGAQHRLLEMLAINTHEAFGSAVADRVRAAVRGFQPNPGLPRYGDGRVAPHEWIMTREGKLYKADNWGHDRDHTAIGPQSVAWDIAGVMVEWDRPKPVTKYSVDDETLRIYVLAYATFQIGMCIQCRQATNDPSERDRLARAEERYRTRFMAAMAANLCG